jgi:NADH:ubiquinone oxidoreductase subunit 6 (subunit J)
VNRDGLVRLAVWALLGALTVAAWLVILYVVAVLVVMYG